MNFSKHLAWAMNPNLSSGDFQRLVEQDAERELDLLREVGEAAVRIAKKHGKAAAYQYLATNLPLALCS